MLSFVLYPVSMRDCVCAQFGTGCTANSTKTFALGHDSKLRALLVAAICDDAPITRTHPDGRKENLDPWDVAEQFHMTDYVRYFVEARLASTSLKAERAAAKADRLALKNSQRKQALTIRATRERERAEARRLALAAQARLLELAEQRTQQYLASVTWDDDEPEPPIPGYHHMS